MQVTKQCSNRELQTRLAALSIAISPFWHAWAAGQENADCQTPHQLPLPPSPPPAPSRLTHGTPAIEKDEPDPPNTSVGESAGGALSAFASMLAAIDQDGAPVGIREEYLRVKKEVLPRSGPLNSCPSLLSTPCLGANGCGSSSRCNA